MIKWGHARWWDLLGVRALPVSFPSILIDCKFNLERFNWAIICLYIAEIERNEQVNNSHKIFRFKPQTAFYIVGNPPTPNHSLPSVQTSMRALASANYRLNLLFPRDTTSSTPSIFTSLILHQHSYQTLLKAQAPSPTTLDKLLKAQPPHRHHAATMAWDGSATQEELMMKDECILVDDSDTIIGHANKYNSHRFNTEQPKGLLHRAFSVFLFDSQNRLLLQQRAASKITFPKVWTNTCCSHPLYGYDPSGRILLNNNTITSLQCFVNSPKRGLRLKKTGIIF